jgi:hypothetical protein
MKPQKSCPHPEAVGAIKIKVKSTVNYYYLGDRVYFSMLESTNEISLARL